MLAQHQPSIGLTIGVYFQRLMSATAVPVSTEARVRISSWLTTVRVLPATVDPTVIKVDLRF